jgi:hypothetical protein
VDAKTVTSTSTVGEGLTYLLSLVGVLILLAVAVVMMNRSKITEPEKMKATTLAK